MDEADWEKQTIEKLASAGLTEQRRARRWGIFFKLLGFAYLTVLILLVLDWRGPDGLGSGKHTALVDVVGGLLLALCLFARAPMAPLLRVVWFTPVLMSYVVVGIIWVWIYDYDWGLANAVLHWVGLGAFEQSWLGHPSTALWSVLVAHEWKWLGFNMIVFLAALHALPAEVLGAAELDNCGWFAKLVYIITPMLRTTIVNLTVLSFIGKMMVFDLIWVMTGGGPLWSTETVSTYVYKRAFEWNTFDLGYPSAIAVLWFIIILAFIAIITRLLRPRDRLEF